MEPWAKPRQKVVGWGRGLAGVPELGGQVFETDDAAVPRSDTQNSQPVRGPPVIVLETGEGDSCFTPPTKRFPSASASASPSYIWVVGSSIVPASSRPS